MTTTKLVRTWLPAAIIVAGLVVAVATGFSETGLEGGALLVSAGLSVWLINRPNRQPNDAEPVDSDQ
jgi:hypothetical protein